MTPEQKLAGLLSVAAHAAPTDAVFCAALAERIARRRAVYRVLAAIPLVLAAAAVLWALQDVVSGEQIETGFAPLSGGVFSLAVALATAFTGRFLAGVLAGRKV